MAVDERTEVEADVHGLYLERRVKKAKKLLHLDSWRLRGFDKYHLDMEQQIDTEFR